MKHTIDATNKRIGRVASEAAKLLMGKNTTDFQRNVAPAVEVEVVNASKLDIPAKKLEEKQYKSFSGYPGGLSMTTMKRVIEKKGHKELIRHAVLGMLPTNKLRSRMIKNLTITD
jgi:large subunit ribosomal protein L13